MSTIFQELAAKLDESCQDIEKDLALGKVNDFGDYKFACGRYRGLLTAKNIIIEMANSMEDDDD
jgi:hypothetical protein